MKQKRRRLLTVFITLSILFLLAILPLACASRPEGLGVREGRLSPCPDSPNCVCSCDTGEASSIEPIAFSGTAASARERLIEIIESTPRASLIESTESYVYAEYRSRIFRFVDDVEFLVDEEKSLIHVRSASRSGYSDLGVNRRRVEAVRERFATLEGGTP